MSVDVGQKAALLGSRKEVIGIYTVLHSLADQVFLLADKENRKLKILREYVVDIPTARMYLESELRDITLRQSEIRLLLSEIRETEDHDEAGVL